MAALIEFAERNLKSRTLTLADLDFDGYAEFLIYAGGGEGSIEAMKVYDYVEETGKVTAVGMIHLDGLSEVTEIYYYEDPQSGGYFYYSIIPNS